MRVRLIANPNASGVDRTLVDRVGAELGPAGDLEVALTEHAGHAVELAGLPVPTWSSYWAETARQTRW
jgi:hypothetical protein